MLFYDHKRREGRICLSGTYILLMEFKGNKDDPHVCGMVGPDCKGQDWWGIRKYISKEIYMSIAGTS